MSPELIIEEIKEEFLKFDPWLVGGAARHISGFPINMEDPIDYDIVIPEVHACELYKFMAAKKWPDSNLNNSDANMGGWKIKFKKVAHMDIWSANIARYLQEVPTAHDGIAINLSSNVHLHTKEFDRAMITGDNFVITSRKTNIINPYRFSSHAARQGINI
jgi:hypothetical protein